MFLGFSTLGLPGCIPAPVLLIVSFCCCWIPAPVSSAPLCQDSVVTKLDLHPARSWDRDPPASLPFASAELGLCHWVQIPANSSGHQCFPSLCAEDSVVGFSWGREPFPSPQPCYWGPHSETAWAWRSSSLMTEQCAHVAKWAGSGRVHQSATCLTFRPCCWICLLMINLVSSFFLINYLPSFPYSFFKFFLVHFKSNTYSWKYFKAVEKNVK